MKKAVVATGLTLALAGCGFFQVEPGDKAKEASGTAAEKLGGIAEAYCAGLPEHRETFRKQVNESFNGQVEIDCP